MLAPARFQRRMGCHDFGRHAQARASFFCPRLDRGEKLLLYFADLALLVDATQYIGRLGLIQISAPLRAQGGRGTSATLLDKTRHFALYLLEHSVEAATGSGGGSGAHITLDGRGSCCSLGRHGVAGEKISLAHTYGPHRAALFAWYCTVPLKIRCCVHSGACIRAPSVPASPSRVQRLRRARRAATRTVAACPAWRPAGQWPG